LHGGNVVGGVQMIECRHQTKLNSEGKTGEQADGGQHLGRQARPGNASLRPLRMLAFVIVVVLVTDPFLIGSIMITTTRNRIVICSRASRSTFGCRRFKQILTTNVTSSLIGYSDSTTHLFSKFCRCPLQSSGLAAQPPRLPIIFDPMRKCLAAKNLYCERVAIRCAFNPHGAFHA